MKTALVTGATGFIGSQLCRELAARSVQVRALHRPTSRIEPLKSLPIELVPGDVTDIESLRHAMKGVDTVYHVAALYREAKFDTSEYWRVNFEGTKNALSAAKAEGVAHFCHCSTTGVLGHIASPPATELAPYGPLDVYQESKTEAEKLVLEWFRERQIRGTIIRPAMVWGPGDTRLFKLFKGIASRMLPIVGSGQTWCHWILIDDLVRAFYSAAITPAAEGGLYIIGGDRPVTLEYTMQKISEEYGVALLPFKIPVWPIQFAGTIVENLCAPFGIEPPLHRRRADFFTKNRSFDCSKAKRDLGFIPRYSFEDEVKLVARWYIENGWINLSKYHHTPERQTN